MKTVNKMKFLPKIVTLGLALALLGGVGAVQAQDSTIDEQTQNLTVDNSIDPVETALENIEFAKIAEKATNFPEGATVKEFGNGTLIVEIPSSEANREKRVSVGVGRRVYVYLTPSEQELITFGGGSMLIAAICNASAGTACAAAAGIISLAMRHVSKHGVCPGRLKASAGWEAGAKCV